LGLMTAIVSTGVQRTHAQTAKPANPLILLAPPDIKWQPTARPDAMRVNVWGDSSKGPFTYFSRYEGGWQLPLHFHTNELRGVIVSGTFVIQVSGQPAKELPGGSYFSIPGTTQHTDACKPGAACIVYFSGDAPLDRVDVPVTGR